MKASKLKKKQVNCPSCGAPATTEICPYCGNFTGIKSADADMEYPVLDCKEIILDSGIVKFEIGMGAIFVLIGAGMLLFFSGFCKIDPLAICIIAVPFALFGVGMIAAPLIPVLRMLRAIIFGKKIKAKVYGYLDDDVIINGRPGQVVKLLINAPEDPKFILYQLQNTLRPYKLYSTVDVRACGNDYMICKNKAQRR